MSIHIYLDGEGFVETFSLGSWLGLVMVYNTLSVPIWKKYPLDTCVKKSLVVVDCQADIYEWDIQHVHRVVSFVV